MIGATVRAILKFLFYVRYLAEDILQIAKRYSKMYLKIKYYLKTKNVS